MGWFALFASNDEKHKDSLLMDHLAWIETTEGGTF